MARKRRKARKNKPQPVATLVTDKKSRQKKLWAATSVIVIPVLIAIGGALYSARLSLQQAGEQEAAAQSGANSAIDAELSKHPPLTVRVRPLDEFNYVWVFPNNLTPDLVRELAGKSKAWLETEGRNLTQEQTIAMGAELNQRRTELGGKYAWEGYINNTRKSTSKHLVSLVGNRREKVRIVSMRYNVLEKMARPGGTLLQFPSEGGVPHERVGADLDNHHGELLLVPEDSRSKPAPFMDVKSLSLEKGEEQGLEVTGYSSASWYKWELEFIVSYGNKTDERVTVRSDGTPTGAPFETVAWDNKWSYTGGYYLRDNNTYELVRE